MRKEDPGTLNSIGCLFTDSSVLRCRKLIAILTFLSPSQHAMGTLMSTFTLNITPYKCYALSAVQGTDLQSLASSQPFNSNRWFDDDMDAPTSDTDISESYFGSHKHESPNQKKVQAHRNADQVIAPKNRNVFTLKPVLIYGNFPEKKPLVLDINRIFHNLNLQGNLEASLSEITALLVADFHVSGVHLHCAYAHNQLHGKSYFCKQGDLVQVICLLPIASSSILPEESSRKIFLANLNHLLNHGLGSLWLNGICISGPEDPTDRIPITLIKVKTVPCRVTLNVSGLIDIHCVRTKSRLEIYGKSVNDPKTKSIWFRGEPSESLMVTNVDQGVMSVFIPSFCDLSNNFISCL